MAISNESAVIRVRSLLASRGQDVSNLRSPRLLALIPDALRTLAMQAMGGNLLRKTFTVTATNGEASLTTPLTASEPMILEGLKRASVFISGFDQPAQWKADRSSLTLPASTEMAYWTVENQTIIVRDGTGMDNYDGTITIRNAPYIPILSSLPVSLESLFVAILADMASVKVAA